MNMSKMNTPVEIKPEVLLCRHSLPKFDRISELKPVTFSSLQPRAAGTVRRLVQSTENYQIMMLGGYPGMNYEQIVRELIAEEPSPTAGMYDLIYVENLEYSLRPIWLMLKPGSGLRFLKQLFELPLEAPGLGEACQQNHRGAGKRREAQELYRDPLLPYCEGR